MVIAAWQRRTHGRRRRHHTSTVTSILFFFVLFRRPHAAIVVEVRTHFGHTHTWREKETEETTRTAQHHTEHAADTPNIRTRAHVWAGESGALAWLCTRPPITAHNSTHTQRGHPCTHREEPPPGFLCRRSSITPLLHTRRRYTTHVHAQARRRQRVTERERTGSKSAEIRGNASVPTHTHTRFANGKEQECREKSGLEEATLWAPAF